MTLKQYICRKGKPVRGSLSRVAQYLGISITWVHKYLDGEWKPNAETSRRIQDFVSSRQPITHRHGKRKKIYFGVKQ